MTYCPDLAALLTGTARAAEIPVDAIPALLAEAVLEHNAISSVERLLLARLIDDARRRGPTISGGEAGSCDDDGNVYLSVRELVGRIPYAEHTIRNLMAAGTLREGEHYFKRRGRVMFSWIAMRRWVEHGARIAASAVPMIRDRKHGRQG